MSPECTAKMALNGLARNEMRVVPSSDVEGDVGGYAPRSIVTPIVWAVYRKPAVTSESAA